MNITLPATTEMMHDLHSSYGIAQMVLTLYLLATAVSMLFLGPLSDRYGRRPAMLFGFMLFIVGSLVCSLAINTEMLLIGRVIQGLGGSAGLSLSRVIVRDVYEREKAASVIGYITMAMVISPMLGPALGGVLTQFASWRFIFWLVLLLSVILFVLVYFYLHETRKPLTNDQPAHSVLQSANALVREPSYLGYAMTITFASGVYFVFLGGAPYICTELMKMSPAQMGLYFMLNAVGYAAGNFISGRYAVKTGSIFLMKIGLFSSVVGIGSLWFFYGVMTPLALFIPMLIITFSNGLVLPGATSGALSVKPEHAGAASGFSGALQIGVAALLTFTIGFIQDDSESRLFILMTLCVLLSVLAFMLARRYEKN
jgi:DHA1 family bicyclomycin/chloramphenicol resistance-like MFS transporter